MKRSLALLTLLCVSLPVCDAQPGGGRNRNSGGRGGFGGSRERIEPKDLKFEMGVAAVPDRELFVKLSYQGKDVGRDPYLADIQYVKFILEDPGTDAARLYFMNTGNYRAHPPYMGMVGISGRNVVRGAISWMPRHGNALGGAGLYVMDFQPNNSYTFEEIKTIHDALIVKAPFLKGRLGFHPLSGNLRQYEADRLKYEQAGFTVHLDSDLYGNIAFLPLNNGVSVGRLRLMDKETRPTSQDILICRSLPNQLPRIAGVLSEARQTPLSHVNLRCVQDKVPNAFIANATEDSTISSLIGKLVRYQVTADGYSIRKATAAEQEEFLSSRRPRQSQTPKRDLSVTEIRPLREISFDDSGSVGVKASNLAAMHRFKLADDMLPNGVAVPFSFYDRFMAETGLYDEARKLLENPEFKQNPERQQTALKELRKKIENADMPAELAAKLAKAQSAFPKATSLRCRSSTNNEDLPGFSGAGLYDSYTHKPDEGHLSKSVKQVFASLWNYRAYQEREFYRVDHFATAMGVLIHPNFKNEKANGVAVTDDVLYESKGNYYLNTQPGEDLVTNPDAESSAEEILLGWWAEDGHTIVRRSADATGDATLISREHLTTMRKSLGQIHGRFAKLYRVDPDSEFAMEVEFKITSDDRLVIKQARPWVF